jgi:hypothetical protein
MKRGSFAPWEANRCMYEVGQPFWRSSHRQRCQKYPTLQPKSKGNCDSRPFQNKILRAWSTGFSLKLCYVNIFSGIHNFIVKEEITLWSHITKKVVLKFVNFFETGCVIPYAGNLVEDVQYKYIHTRILHRCMNTDSMLKIESSNFRRKT